MTHPADLPAPLPAFLDAVDRRDAEAIGPLLTDEMAYHLIVPHRPVVGRDTVVAALARSLGEADRVRWDVVAWAVADDLVFLERVDRFWFGEREAAIECTGVVRLERGLIAEIRDYADLGTWRSRRDAALA